MYESGNDHVLHMSFTQFEYDDKQPRSSLCKISPVDAFVLGSRRVDK